MAEKLPFGEGASIKRSPLFCGLHYQLWKVRMKIFVESIDRGIWDAIVNDPFVPNIENDDVFIKKPWSQWTESETKNAQYDCIVKNIIYSALNSNEFFRVSKFAFAKEMWDILEVIHEGTIDVKNNKDKNQPSNRYNTKNVNEFNSTNYTCFGCGKQGHIKAEYPSNVSKEKGGYKKYKKKGKSRRAYNDDSSSSSSSKDDEEANLYFMTKEESKSNSVSSSSSINVENYSQHLEAFEETHEEANRFALLNNRLKGLNNWLENKVKTLEEELNNSKIGFESLEMIYKNSYCKCDFSFCENCESLEKKVHYLLKTVDKFSKGQSNLEFVLASQKWGLIQTARTYC